MGGTYVRHGDYFIPCLTLPEEEQRFIGVWGQRHLRYLKEYRRGVYLNLLTSGRLNDYLSDIAVNVWHSEGMRGNIQSLCQCSNKFRFRFSCSCFLLRF